MFKMTLGSEPPSQEDILVLLSGKEAGDIRKAKQSLMGLLSPLKDLLALSKFIGDLENTSARQVELLKEQGELLKEQDQARTDLDAVKVQIGDAKTTLKNQAAKIEKAGQEATANVAKQQNEIASLEKVKADLGREIEAAEKQKAALPQLIATEYGQLRVKMLSQLKSEEDEASANLKTLISDISAAEAKLAQVKQAMANLIESAKGLTG